MIKRDEHVPILNHVFEFMTGKRLRLYCVMLARVCLEKDPETFSYTLTGDPDFADRDPSFAPPLLHHLLEAFVDWDTDEREAADALAAIHIVIKHNFEVGYVMLLWL